MEYQRRPPWPSHRAQCKKILFRSNSNRRKDTLHKTIELKMSSFPAFRLLYGVRLKGWRFPSVPIKKWLKRGIVISSHLVVWNQWLAASKIKRKRKNNHCSCTNKRMRVFSLPNNVTQNKNSHHVKMTENKKESCGRASICDHIQNSSKFCTYFKSRKTFVQLWR